MGVWKNEIVFFGEKNVLLAPVVVACTRRFVVEIACVLDRHFVPLLGLVDAVALFEDFPGDAHC